jgi:hypothetical protein
MAYIRGMRQTIAVFSLISIAGANLLFNGELVRSITEKMLFVRLHCCEPVPDCFPGDPCWDCG